MIVIGVLLNIVGLGIFCWALFALAIHALPFFVGTATALFGEKGFPILHGARGRMKQK